MVFAVAGASKIAAGPQWPAQAADLGTPQWVARAVPWVELLVAAAVAARVAMPWSAVGAIVLLGVFTVLLVVRLCDGDRPPCACFGGWSTRPLSWWHVARNLGLIALAAVTIVA